MLSTALHSVFNYTFFFFCGFDPLFGILSSYSLLFKSKRTHTSYIMHGVDETSSRVAMKEEQIIALHTLHSNVKVCSIVAVKGVAKVESGNPECWMGMCRSSCSSVESPLNALAAGGNLCGFLGKQDAVLLFLKTHRPYKHYFYGPTPDKGDTHDKRTGDLSDRCNVY